MKAIKIVIIGAGSSYTPELIDGFIKEKEDVAIDTLTFVDIDAERANICAGMTKKMLSAVGNKCKFIVESDLKKAAVGADFVINQIRVGCMDARIQDEKIPLQYGLLGQETTGAGGFANGLRTIPRVVEIAKVVECVAPNCWFLNFTNPSGMVTQAIMDHTNLKAMGLCNGPINMLEAVRTLLGGMEFDYQFVGLNHLCWITSVIVQGKDMIQQLFSEDFDAASKLQNIPEYEYDIDLLRATGGLPIGYMKYYYYQNKQVEKMKQEEKTRGEICKEIEQELMALYKDPAVIKKPELLGKRGGAGYSQMAVAIIKSIMSNDGSVHIVNTRNNGAYPFMKDSDVVEVNSIISSDKVKPEKYEGNVNAYMIGMMQAVKSFERLTIKAAMNGDKDSALAALMVHPLIGDFDRASRVLDNILEVNKPYLDNFVKSGAIQ